VTSFIGILSEKNQPVNTSFCPSRANCQIITVEGFVNDPARRAFYINAFCEAGEGNWGKCRRYQTKKTLNLCPDFVMPDSLFTTDEILDKLEE